MDRAKTSEFRITPAPGIVLPEPAVFRADYSWKGGGWLEVNLREELVDVPERVYQYQLADVNLRDPRSLADLAEQLGGLLVPVGNRARWSDTVAVAASRGGEDAEYWDLMASLAADAGLPDCDPARLGSRPERRLHVVELAARVWDVQVMSAVWRGEVKSTRLGSRGFPDLPVSVTHDFLAHRSALLLGVFGPCLSTRPSPLAHRATVLEVAALQLFNDVVRGQPWKTCPFCHRPFTAQRGRAKHGPDDSHRRSDAKYCQKRCANAAAQEKYRARVKEASNARQ